MENYLTFFAQSSGYGAGAAMAFIVFKWATTLFFARKDVEDQKLELRRDKFLGNVMDRLEKVEKALEECQANHLVKDVEFARMQARIEELSRG